MKEEGNPPHMQMPDKQILRIQKHRIFISIVSPPEINGVLIEETEHHFVIPKSPAGAQK